VQITKLFTIAIFCDLQKAFDTVDHTILLKKLCSIGVRGIELHWFKNYLSNRKQFVNIDGINSVLLDILIGVPQGSILGPLLFLIYINDLPTCSNFDDSLFADDTTLNKSHANLKELESIVNLEFQKILYFFQSHKLSLHPEKTKFMLFTSTAPAASSAARVNRGVLTRRPPGDVLDRRTPTTAAGRRRSPVLVAILFSRREPFFFPEHHHLITVGQFLFVWGAEGVERPNGYGLVHFGHHAPRWETFFILDRFITLKGVMHLGHRPLSSKGMARLLSAQGLTRLLRLSP